MNNISDNIADTLASIKKQMTAAAVAAGRAPESIRLVAVSKTHGVEAVRAALAAGQRVFGENRVQEAALKFSDLRNEFPDIELHLIGPLQTNKVEDSVRLFDVIQSVDRIKLADALAKAIKKIGCTPKLYVEVNVGGEAQKAGVAPEQVKEFLDQCRNVCGLTISGLMCIPPHGQDPVPYFQKLKSLADENGLPTISMGMSADFECAIRCGATEIRVGNALFGAR